LTELAERLPNTSARSRAATGQFVNPNATGEYLPGTSDDEFWMTGLR
jgi:hypothetical protein